MLKDSNILHLIITWAILSVVLFIFALIVHSTNSYKERKRFWFTQLLAVGIAYALSAALVLLLHSDIILAITNFNPQHINVWQRLPHQRC